MIPSAPRPDAPPVSAARLWLQGTLLAACLVAPLDATILQRKKSFFTGGFLSATHAASLFEGAGFLLISFVVDCAVIGVAALAVAWLTSRARLSPLARRTAIALGAAAPVVAWDFISYRLLAYFGEAFDLALMFDLTGKRPGEILAVASAHMLAPAGLLALGTASIWFVVRTLNRRGPHAVRTIAVVSRSLLLATLLVFAGGLVIFGAASRSSDLMEDGLRRKASGQIYTRMLDRLSDFDGDGYGIGGRLGDPAPFDAAIYPYALDVPGNGLDEDGIAGDLPPGPPYEEPVIPAGSWKQRPNVVLFVLESFRADAVGRVVNGIPVTPAIDALAREGISSSRAFSHNGYTTQSRFHLFTANLAGAGPAKSLVDDFKAQGYETAYFSAQDESFGGPALGVGFDRADVAYDARNDRDRRYSTFTTAGSLAVPHTVLRARIDEFLERRDTSRPLFLYVNFHDTHFPYQHRDLEPILSNRRVPQAQIAPSHRDAVHEMYYNAAANVDRALGATLETLTRALGAPPAVIVTGDHGESLFDEGFLGHGYALNDIQTRIPLVARGLPLTITEPFGQIDLRGALSSALLGETGGGPHLTSDPKKKVFQYLGNVHRPREIAFTTLNGTFLYDFRDREVQLPDGTRRSPTQLSGPAAEEFQRLVQFWERVMLLRASQGRRDE